MIVRERKSLQEELKALRQKRRAEDAAASVAEEERAKKKKADDEAAARRKLKRLKLNGKPMRKKLIGLLKKKKPRSIRRAAEGSGYCLSVAEGSQ